MLRLNKGTVQNAIPYILGILLLWFAQSKRVSFSIHYFESWAMGRWGAGAGGRRGRVDAWPPCPPCSADFGIVFKKFQ